MRDEHLTEVRRLELFAACREETCREVVRGAFLQRFPASVVLIREGDPADFMCVLIEGRVELFAGGNGRTTTLDIAEPPTTLVLAAILTDRLYLQSARTLEDCRVLLVPAENVRAAMERDAGFASALAREVSLRYRRLVKEVKELKLRTGTERLANWILRNASDEGGAPTVMLDIEKRVLASRLGITPENLSRAFATLAQYGVRTNGPRIEVGDPAALAQLAKPADLIDDPAV